MCLKSAYLTAALFVAGTLAATSSSAAPSTASPIDAIDQNVTAKYRLYNFHGCSSGDKGAVLDALNEAHDILKVDGNYYITSYWNNYGVVEFFGSPYLFKVNNHRDGLSTNLRNAYDFTNGWWFQSHTTSVYCHDASLPDKGSIEYSKACGSAEYPESIVVAPAYDGSNTAIMFCDSWFKLSRLSDAYNAAQKAPYNDKYDLGLYENRARPWITAMMLMPSIGTYPKDPAGNTLIKYQKYNLQGNKPPIFAVTAAQCKGATKARLGLAWSYTDNPSSYSWYALSSYVQDKMGDYPVKPFLPEGLMA